jgi:glutamine synthetase
MSNLISNKENVMANKITDANKWNKTDKYKALTASLVEQGVEYLIPSYVDMHGVPKTKMVPIAHLERMMGGSELFTGAALDGVPQDVSDEEVAAMPDADKGMILPWKPDTAWFPSDLWCEGKPFPACSRGILKRVLKKAEDMGFTVNCGIEAEFYVFKDGENGNYEPTSTRYHLEKPAYDVARLLENTEQWLGELVRAMNNLHWDVYSFDHEDGTGQFEIDFDYSDALTMADRFTFLRTMSHEMTRKHGYFASWMPKPYGDKAGSGAHYNISLADKETGKNLFTSDNDPRGCGLSELGYKFIAGVLRHLPAIQAVSAPTVNSYKRLIIKGSTSGYTWAPCFVSYGNNNRTNTVRIPREGGRVELRSADSACNPYLGIAMMVAAGLKGIEENLDPGEPFTDNMYTKTDEERSDLGVRWLPRTLEQALDEFEADSLSRDVFGEEMYNSWLKHKRNEWMLYTNHISDWEKARYLKQF